jgi:hypothetical protein
VTAPFDLPGRPERPLRANTLEEHRTRIAAITEVALEVPIRSRRDPHCPAVV